VESWTPERIALGVLCLRQAQAERDEALRKTKGLQGVVDLGRL
jgi:hypothetical protein